MSGQVIGMLVTAAIPNSTLLAQPTDPIASYGIDAGIPARRCVALNVSDLNRDSQFAVSGFESVRITTEDANKADLLKVDIGF